MVNIFRKYIKWQRVLYTLCFFALCIIDWAKTSLNGRMQMTATNMTGIVVAIIIFSSFDIKKLKNWSYYIWLMCSVTLIPFGTKVALKHIPYKGQIITASINIAIYGFVLIYLIKECLVTKKVKDVKLHILALWLLMLFSMFVSVNENIWPVWYAVVFGAFYILDFDTNEYLHVSIVDGIIIGFFVIQGVALLFRPYDVVRYVGLYVNPNMNSLFYLMSYSAFLCKWFLLKIGRKHLIYRIFTCLFAGAMYGFCIFTGSKTAILSMILATIPFCMVSMKLHKNRILSFFRHWIILGMVGMMSIPIVYGAIRYIPTIHLHPLYFEGEYSILKVQPGEPRDSDKYITFVEAMDTNLGRFMYRIPQVMKYFDSIVTLRVHAAELDDTQEKEYIFSIEEYASGVDPIRLRYEIHKYFFTHLNLIGHKNDYEGAPIRVDYTAPHAHNVFLQMAFLYGVPSGILFIIMNILFFPTIFFLIKSGEFYKACIISCFIIAFMTFGFFEIDWMCGQLPFTLLFVLFRDVVKSKMDIRKNKIR